MRYMLLFLSLITYPSIAKELIKGGVEYNYSSLQDFTNTNLTIDTSEEYPYIVWTFKKEKLGTKLGVYVTSNNEKCYGLKKIDRKEIGNLVEHRVQLAKECYGSDIKAIQMEVIIEDKIIYTYTYSVGY